MSDHVWAQAYLDGFRRAARVLLGIQRSGQRDHACLKVLLDAAESLTSRASSAVSTPSIDHVVPLARIAGAAGAAGAVIEQGRANLELTVSSTLVRQLLKGSSRRVGEFASPLMAASDGDMRTLLYEGAVPELQAGVQAGRSADARWLVPASQRINAAALFLAQVNASAEARPAELHDARAEKLNQQVADTSPVGSSRISAHAWAVHYLTGIYGPGDSGLRQTMLRLIATYPSHERAALQASKVAALLSDAPGLRARMGLLDQILILLGPSDPDPPVRMALARDSALVLLLLDTGAVAPGESTDSSKPGTQSSTVASSQSAEHRQEPEELVNADGGEYGNDAIAEIAQEAERAIIAAVAEREARYQRAVDNNSLAEALAVVRDAAADDDHEQAWVLLEDIARRHPEADPRDLVTVAADVLGPIALDSDGVFDGPGAGCFTVLSPAPARAGAAIARVAARLLNVDDRGIEHSDSEVARTAGAYTPNFLHDLAWCARGVQVSLDTKGSITAPMARAMLAIITQALVDDRVPALITGWIPALDSQMIRWGTER